METSVVWHVTPVLFELVVPIGSVRVMEGGVVLRPDVEEVSNL